MSGDDALERELDLLLALSGIVVPPDRKAGTLAGYADQKRMTALLRQPRDAESEPANAFSALTILRSLAQRTE